MNWFAPFEISFSWRPAASFAVPALARSTFAILPLVYDAEPEVMQGYEGTKGVPEAISLSRPPYFQRH